MFDFGNINQYKTRVSKALIERGVVALFDMKSGIELISNQKFSSNTASNAVTGSGESLDYSGTARTVFGSKNQYYIGAALTIFAFVEIDALTDSTPIISKWSGGLLGGVPVVTPYILEIGTGTFTLRHGTATNRSYAQAPSTVISAGFKGVFAITRKNGNAYFSGNEAKVYVGNTETVCSTNWDNQSYTGPATDDDADIWIGRGIDGLTQLDGRIAYIGLANTVLPRNVIQGIIDDPFSVYERVSSIVPIPTVSPSNNRLVQVPAGYKIDPDNTQYAFNHDAPVRPGSMPRLQGYGGQVRSNIANINPRLTDVLQYIWTSHENPLMSRDILRGRYVAASSVSNTPHGSEIFSGNNSSGGAGIAFKTTPVTLPIVIITRLRSRATSAATASFFRASGGNDITISASNPNITLSVQANAGTARTTSVSVDGDYSGKTLTIVAQIFSSTDYRLYVDGKMSTGTLDCGSPFTINLFYGLGTNAGTLAGTSFTGYGEGTALSDAEALEISRMKEDFWELFSSKTKALPFPGPRRKLM